jgi:predicted MFS family arabinose efflux permease
MRGRVMSVYNVAFRGGMPIGNLAAGSLIEKFNAPFIVAVNGCLLAVLGIYFFVGHRKISNL